MKSRIKKWSLCTLGVGINVQLTEADLAGIDQPATSLYIATKGKMFNEKEVLATYLNNFIDLVDSYTSKPEKFFEPFYSNMTYIGESIIVHDDFLNRDIEGKIKGVDKDGFLILDVGSSEDITVHSGTVVKKH